MSGTPSPFPPAPGARTTPHRIQRLWHRIGYRARGRHADGGFTLLEVVVSFVIFAIVSTAAVLAIANGMQTSGYTSDRIQAANVAQAALQQARANPSAVIATPTPTASTTSVGNNVYTVRRSATVPTAGGTSCPAGSAMPVTVVVTWSNGGGRQVRMDTVIAC